jgi:hypothetical protein
VLISPERKPAARSRFGQAPTAGVDDDRGAWLLLKFDLFEDGLKLLQDCHSERQSLGLGAKVLLIDIVLLRGDLLILLTYM